MFTVQELRDAQYYHALHYLKQLQVVSQLCRKSGTQLLRALTKFESDWPQIEQGQEWTARNLEDEQAALLCGEFSLAGADLLSQHRAVEDRIRWLEAAQEAAQRLGLQAALCEHLCNLGKAYWQAGKILEAVDSLEQALVIAEIDRYQAQVAKAHHHLGEIAASQAAYSEALQHGTTSLDIYEVLGDRQGIADTVAMLGNLALLKDDYPEADRLFHRGLLLYRELGDHAGEAHVLARQGSLAGTQRNFALAGEYFSESHTIYTTLDHQEGIGQTANMLGTVATCLGNFAQAEAWYQQSLKVYTRLGYQDGIAAAHMKLGEIDQYASRWESAQTHYGMALEIYEALKNSYHISGLLFRLGNVALSKEDYAGAEQWLLRCVPLCRDVNPPLLASALNGLAQIATQQGQYQEARQLFQEGLSIAEDNGDAWIIADLHQEYGNLALEMNDFLAAQTHLHQALELAAAMEAAPLMLSILGSIACALAETKQAAVAFEAAYFVHESPSSLQFDKDQMSTLIQKLRRQLSSESVTAIEEQTRLSSLESLVKKVLVG